MSVIRLKQAVRNYYEQEGLRPFEIERLISFTFPETSRPSFSQKTNSPKKLMRETLDGIKSFIKKKGRR